MGNRVRFSVRLLVRKGGGRSLCDPDPDKSFKINRVPAKANICSGLVSRRKKPSAKAGRFRFIARQWRPVRAALFLRWHRLYQIRSRFHH